MNRTALLLVFCSSAGWAADPTAWRLARVTTAARDGLTVFEVLKSDEHGGSVKIIRSPKDESCPGGATYELSWRIDGDARRVAVGSTLLVSFEGHQTGGQPCPNGEPLARAATGLNSIEPGWAPGSFFAFEGPGYREFYLHPEKYPERHLAQWKVGVPKSEGARDLQGDVLFVERQHVLHRVQGRPGERDRDRDRRDDELLAPGALNRPARSGS